MGRYIYIWIGYGMVWIWSPVGGYMSLYRVLYEQGPINCPLNWSFFLCFLCCVGRRNTTARAREGVVVKRI